jgi:uncharacterized protein YbaR (Trm112 family)
MLESYLNHVVRCPACHGELATTSSGAECRQCKGVYPFRSGILDFAPEISASSTEEQPGSGQRTMEDRNFVKDYVGKYRGIFVKIMGMNFLRPITFEDEARYIRDSCLTSSAASDPIGSSRRLGKRS